MFCGKFGNRWRASGGHDPGPVTSWSLLSLFFFFYVALGKRNISLSWRFPCALVFRVSSWEVVMVARQWLWDTCYMDSYPATAYVHCWSTVCFNPVVGSLDWLTPSPELVSIWRMFILLVCGVNLLCFTIVYHFRYFILSTIITNLYNCTIWSLVKIKE